MTIPDAKLWADIQSNPKLFIIGIWIGDDFYDGRGVFPMTPPAYLFLGCIAFWLAIAAVIVWWMP